MSQYSKIMAIVALSATAAIGASGCMAEAEGTSEESMSAEHALAGDQEATADHESIAGDQEGMTQEETSEGQSELAALLLTLSGCGGGGDTADPAESDGAANQASDPQFSGEPSTAEATLGVDEPPNMASPHLMAQQQQQSSEQLQSQDVQAAALRPCWNTPNRWLGQVDGKDTDALNMIVCLDHGVTWSRVFDALKDLPGRKFDRRWPWPSIRVPWREVRPPVSLRDGHCINGVKASLDGRGWLEQGFSGREEGCGSILRSQVNHFRVWQQQSSAALFIGVSTDSPCLRDYVKPSHCVDSYDGGRALLYADLLKASANAGLKTNAAWFTAVPGGGSLKQADGASVRYDGKVWVVWISR